MIDWILDPLRQGITQRALLELLILGVVCGPLGVWVVLFRQSYAAESIAHAMLPGLVLAALISAPLGLGAALGLAVAAGLIAVASRQSAVSPDVAVAVTVTTLFGIGTLLALSPDVPLRLGELLFGDPLSVSAAISLASACLAAVALAALAAGHRTLLLSGFDPQSAGALGAGNRRAAWLLLTLLALTVLIAVQALGNLLVVAIVVAPAAAALRLSARLDPRPVRLPQRSRSQPGSPGSTSATTRRSRPERPWHSARSRAFVIALVAARLSPSSRSGESRPTAGPSSSGRSPPGHSCQRWRLPDLAQPIDESALGVHPVPGGLQRGGHHRDPEPILDRIQRARSRPGTTSAAMWPSPSSSESRARIVPSAAQICVSPIISVRQGRPASAGVCDSTGPDVGGVDGGSADEPGDLPWQVPSLEAEDRVLAPAPPARAARPS